MTTYFVKSSACLIILYLAYALVFRKSRNYNINRIVLLSCVLFSVTVPLININIGLPDDAQTEYAVRAIGTLNSSLKHVMHPFATDSGTGYPDKLPIISTCYLIVSLALFLRFISHLAIIFTKAHRSEKVNHNGITLTLLDEKVNPFTFLSMIFISKESYKNKRIDNDMILHELAHRNEAHSVDILLMEIMTVFFWFNPVIYLFKRLIQANHEYLADDFVLRSGVSVTDYSNKIINHSFKIKRAGFVSGFNKVFIKHRLELLTKFRQKKDPALQLIPFALLLSVLFAVTAFRIVSDPIQGTFSADSIRWSDETEIRMEGNLKIKFGRNDFTGQGSFSGFDKGTILIVDNKRAAVNESINLSGKSCRLVILTKEQAKSKYGTDGTMEVAEVYTSR